MEFSREGQPAMFAYLHDPFSSLMFWLTLIALVLGVGVALLCVVVYLHLKRRGKRKATGAEVDSRPAN